MGADITALYTMFAVKYLLLIEHSPVFSQLHRWLLEFWLNDSWIMGSNNCAYISTVTLAILKILAILCFGK